ncbi:MAG: hypothetical protein AABY84_02465 [Candidatus Firestonebacteria bacterium]
MRRIVIIKTQGSKALSSKEISQTLSAKLKMSFRQIEGVNKFEKSK